MGRRHPFASRRAKHKSECGQTVLLVAISAVALISMAALAIDVTTLYIARAEADKAATAGALAGARSFVSSGFTSYRLGIPTSGSAQSTICNNSTGLADVQAKAAANQNLIGGKPPASVTTACSFPQAQNPRISVTVRATGLPTFFSRIWGTTSNQVTAVASAEAYNPSGQDVPVQVASVKPWLIPNCDYSNPGGAALNSNCPPSASYFIDPNNDYQVANLGNFIGRELTLQQLLPTVGNVIVPTLLNSYVALDLQPDATSLSCPALSRPSCSGLNPGSPGYAEAIACANSKTVKCGDRVRLLPFAGPLLGVLEVLTPGAIDAPKCLIHATDVGLNKGQDNIISTPLVSDPITIDAGDQNPNVDLQSKVNISRSDSVVTVPIYDPDSTLFLLHNGDMPKVVGFMQLGIKQVEPGLTSLLTSQIDAVILNVSGCGNATGTAVSGGKSSPIPVRLVQ
jgi:hypothetical protein